MTILQEETQEYLEEAKLKELVAKYSEFINFPIYLYASKEVDVPVDEAADEAIDESESSEDEETVDDDEDVADDGGLSFCCHQRDCGDTKLTSRMTIAYACNQALVQEF